MARPKKNIVHLLDDDVKYLKDMIRKTDTSKSTVNRCRILLALDENHPPCWTYDECTAVIGVSRATIASVAKSYCDGGIGSALERKRSANSDNARRKVDERTKARLLKVACGPAPEGHSRWTIRLLEDEMKAVLDEPISRETIRRILKRTNLDLTAAITGASRAKRTQSL